jgi:hypothetical protein
VAITDLSSHPTAPSTNRTCSLSSQLSLVCRSFALCSAASGPRHPAASPTSDVWLRAGPRRRSPLRSCMSSCASLQLHPVHYPPSRGRLGVVLGCLHCGPGHVPAASATGGHFTVSVLPDAADGGLHDVVPLVDAVDEGVPSRSRYFLSVFHISREQCGFIWPLCSLLSLSSCSESD